MFGLAPRPRGGARQQSKLQPPVAGKDGDSLTVGRRVRTHPKGLQGVVRYMGQSHFAEGMWIGVELDTADGRNDGEVQGHRYFACTPGHGVFVRPENCVAIKGAGSTASAQAAERRTRNSFDRSQTGRKGPMGFENAGPSNIPQNSSSTVLAREPWGAGSDAGSIRKENTRRMEGVSVVDRRNNSGIDDQIIGRLLASEAFSRVLSAKVADGVRTELVVRDAYTKVTQDALMGKLGEVENMVDEACGAMDDIAAMVQTISEQIHSTSTVPDSSDAAAGREVSGGEGVVGGDGSDQVQAVDDVERRQTVDEDVDGGGPGGDAGGGGGGRDDARVAELTKLLCTVHKMSSQAAELLRRERKENLTRIKFLSDRVHDLEERQIDSNGTVPSEFSEG